MTLHNTLPLPGSRSGLAQLQQAALQQQHGMPTRPLLDPLHLVPGRRVHNPAAWAQALLAGRGGAAGTFLVRQHALIACLVALQRAAGGRKHLSMSTCLCCTACCACYVPPMVTVHAEVKTGLRCLLSAVHGSASIRTCSIAECCCVHACWAHTGSQRQQQLAPCWATCKGLLRPPARLSAPPAWR